MDLLGLSGLLRWPLEIVSIGLALSPLLSVSLAWTSLPYKIPTHFDIAGHPDRWRPRNRVWVLPALALIVYGFLCQASGTWAWALQGRADLPPGAEIPLLVKPWVALLLVYANSMFLRPARVQKEALNGWLLSGLMILLLTPPLALSFAGF